MRSNFTLRQMCPEDGPAIATLSEQCPDTGAVANYSRFLHDPYASLLALRPLVTGVVVDAPDHDGIVGMGLMNMGSCQYEGTERPFAYLYSLSVHPDYRRRGIASQIAAWRVEKARATFGKEGVIFAGIQRGNTGSFLTANKWSTQRLDGRTQVGVVKMRSRPPKRTAGLEVRQADENDFEQIAEGQNAFYQAYNLYPPRTAGDLSAWIAHSIFGMKLHEYYVVLDKGGNILAGAGFIEEGKLINNHVTRVALPLRIANTFLKVIPADGVTRRIKVVDMWFVPGHKEAYRYLWESMRWLWRERGTMMMAFFDPKGPLKDAIPLPRLLPSSGGSIVLTGPLPLREERSIYMHM